MKRVLITGAAGTIGLQTLKYLLAEGKYEITALDLKNKSAYRKLKKYSRRVNVIYGDILDRNLVEKLVKDTDIIIHLASCLPPVCNYYQEIPKIIETEVTENIVRAINYYNPDCYLIYGSSTSLYDHDDASVKDIINEKNLSNFSKAKYDSEKCIIKTVKKYTILRIPLVLGDFRTDNFIYSIPNNSNVECITKEDAALCITGLLNQNSKVNKKIFNISSGIQTTFVGLKNYILKVHGISNKYIAGALLQKDYTSPTLADTENLNKLLNYQNDTFKTYFNRQRKRSKHRSIHKLIGKLFIKK